MNTRSRSLIRRFVVALVTVLSLAAGTTRAGDDDDILKALDDIGKALDETSKAVDELNKAVSGESDEEKLAEAERLVAQSIRAEASDMKESYRLATRAEELSSSLTGPRAARVNAHARYQQTRFLISSNRIDEADAASAEGLRRLVAEGVEETPQGAVIHIARATVEAERGNHAPAAAESRAALVIATRQCAETDGARQLAHLRHGLSLLNLPKPTPAEREEMLRVTEEGVRLYREHSGMKSEGTYSMLSTRLRALRDAGRLEEAVQVGDEMVRAARANLPSPSEQEALGLAGRGRALMALGRREKAIADFERALEIRRGLFGEKDSRVRRLQTELAEARAAKPAPREVASATTSPTPAPKPTTAATPRPTPDATGAVARATPEPSPATRPAVAAAPTPAPRIIPAGFKGFPGNDPCDRKVWSMQGVPWKATPPGREADGKARMAKYTPLPKDFSIPAYRARLGGVRDGMRAVYGEMSEQDSAIFEALWAPFDEHPTPEADAYFRALQPLLDEYLAIAGDIAAIEPAYAESLSEGSVAAYMGDERGARAAAEAARRTAERLRDAKGRMADLVGRIRELGDPPNPLEALCAARKHHRRAVPAQTPWDIEGEWVVLNETREEGDASGPQRGDHLYFKTVAIVNDTHRVLYAPSFSEGGAPHELFYDDIDPFEVLPDGRLYRLAAPLTTFYFVYSVQGDSLRCTVYTPPNTFNPHKFSFRQFEARRIARDPGARAPWPTTWQLTKEVPYDEFWGALDGPKGREMADAQMTQKGKLESGDGAQDRDIAIAGKVSQARLNQLAYQKELAQLESWSVENDINMAVSARIARAASDGLGQTPDAAAIRAEVEPEIRAKRERDIADLRAKYGIGGDGAPAPTSSAPTPTPDPEQDALALSVAMTAEAQKQAIADKEESIRYFVAQAAAREAELARTKDPAARQQLQMMILGYRDSIQREKDEITTMVTGNFTRTRTEYDAYNEKRDREKFIQQTEQMKWEAQKDDRLMRIAGLFEGAEREEMRDFVSKGLMQATGPERQEKLRQMASVMQQRLLSKADAAQAEELYAAAKEGLASDIKSAMDTGIMIGATFGTGGAAAIAMAYTGATGYAEGGVVKAGENLVRAYSNKIDYACTFIEGYQAGGLEGGAEGLAKAYFMNHVMDTAGESYRGWRKPTPPTRPDVQIDAFKSPEQRLAEDTRAVQKAHAVPTKPDGTVDTAHPDYAAKKDAYEADVAKVNARHDVAVRRSELHSKLDAITAQHEARIPAEARNPDGTPNTDHPEYKRIEAEWRQDMDKAREPYRGENETRGARHRDILAEAGLSEKDVPSSGSDPESVMSDMDVTPGDRQSALAYVNAAKKKGHNVVACGDRWIITDLDMTIWNPGGDAVGSSTYEASVEHGSLFGSDKFSTEGGKESTGGGGARDPRGAIIANTKKACEAGISGGGDGADFHVVGKSVDKATSIAPDAKADPAMVAQAKALRKHRTPEEAGVATFGNPPAAKKQQKADFLRRSRETLTGAYESASAASAKLDAERRAALAKAEAEGDKETANRIRRELISTRVSNEVAIRTIAEKDPGMMNRLRSTEAGVLAGDPGLPPPDPGPKGMGRMGMLEDALRRPADPAAAEPSAEEKALAKRCNESLRRVRALAATKPKGSPEAAYLADLEAALADASRDPRALIARVKAVSGFEFAQVEADLRKAVP